MLGKDSVRAHLRNLGRRRAPEQPPHVNLVENTAAAVSAQLSRLPLDGRWLQVEVHEQPAAVHPLTGKPVVRPPTAILRQGAKPLAVLIGDLLVVSRTAPRCVRTRLIGEARASLLDHEEVRDDRLLKLMPA
jgi:hypothetical protein